MAISAGDLINMRGAMQSVVPHLNVTPKVIIGTAVINQSVFTYPLGALTVDTVSLNGSLADLTAVPVGSLVWVGTTAGAHDVLTTVVRKTCTSTVLYIAGMGKGDPGVSVDEITALADDQYVTILAVKPPWGILSRIHNSTFYKAFDVAYSDQGESPAPVCNLGPWQRLALTGETVAVTLTNAAVTDVKPASFAWGEKTIASYAWSLRNESYGTTGGTFDATNAAAATITFTTAGFYIVYCTITDSDSKTHTAETYIWVVDGSTETDIAGWLVEQDRQTREGRQMTIVMHGDVAETAVFPGAGFLYSESQVYNGATVTAGATVDRFVGWMSAERAIREVTHGRVEFDVLAPSLTLKETPAAPQYVIEDASPANWTEVTSTLSNPNGVAWYILAHHCPNMLAVHDFDPLIDPSTGSRDASQRDHIWTVSSRSVWGQILEILPHQLNKGCRSSGALCIRHDPQLMDDTDRTALDSRMTWAAGDIREELVIPENFRLRTGMVDAYAFSYAGGTNATPYWSRSPGDAQANGVDLQTVNGLVVPHATAQASLNVLAGHLFAKANNPTPQLVVKAMRNLDTADPALMVWHKLTIASTLDPRGRGYTDKRIIPLQVTRNWQQTPEGWVKNIDIIFEPETVGVAGTTKAIPTASETVWDPYGDWNGGFFDNGWITDGFNVDWFGMTRENATIAAFSTDGNMYRTWDFTTPDANGGPTWEAVDLTAGITGTPLQFVVDAFSYTDGGGIDGWLFTSTGIYKIDDIFGGTPALTEQHLYTTITVDLDDDRINADASFAESGFVVGAINSAAGAITTLVTTDGGATWSQDTLTSSDASMAGQTPLVWVSSRTPGKAYVGGYRASVTGVETSLLTDKHGWDVINDAGTWVSGTGFESEYMNHPDHDDNPGGDDQNEYLDVQITLEEATYIDKFYYYTSSSLPNILGWRFSKLYLDGVFIGSLGKPGSNGEWNSWTGLDTTATTIRLFIGITATTDPQYYARFTAFKINDDVSGAYGVIYETDDYGATWTATSMTLGDSLGGDIDVAWADETEETLTYGRKPDGDNSTFWTDGSTSGAITPAQDAGTWSPVKGRWSVETSPTDATRMLLCAEDGAGNYSTFVSSDGGASWTQIVSGVAGTGTYLRGALSDDVNALYLWGGGRRIAWSADGGTTIDDRMGNIETGGAGEFIGICGGPTA